MTYRQALYESSARLEESRIIFCDTPLLDASVLLAFAAGISREQLFARYPDELPHPVFESFSRLIEKRLSGLPVSYIRNTKEFFGRDFYVDERVLVPRPDTETLIEKALGLLEPGTAPSVLDLCTGSGCIAATLKLERPDALVTASDVSADALEVAALNCGRLGAGVELIESSLFSSLEDLTKYRFDMIITNPPYVESSETDRMADAGWPEPRLALDGGPDGLDLIREIVTESLDYLHDNSYLLIEAGPEQAESIARLMAEAGFTDVEITRDLAGRNRVTSGRTSGPQDKEI